MMKKAVTFVSVEKNLLSFDCSLRMIYRNELVG